MLAGGVGSRAAEPHDTLCRQAVTVYAGPSRQIAIDGYERKWLRHKDGFVLGAELSIPTAGPDDDGTDADYGYPTLSLGAKLSLNYDVTMRRTPDPAWGMAEMVDYDSRLGHFLTLYGAFDRPLLRCQRWQLAYTLRTGIAFGNHPYNPRTNVDNELIGSRLTIYVGLGLLASYRLSPRHELVGGVLYGHHSNGALARPNKGENHITPVVGIRSGLSHHKNSRPTYLVSPTPNSPRSPFPRHWYAMLRLGVGGKTLLEDWQQTQFRTPPGAPDYRTSHFRLYAAYSASADLMCRYARRWASGVGADVFYGTYYDHLPMPSSSPTSPWSVGLALRHEAYYHQLSVDMSLGAYLFRRMGDHAREVEKPYYERIGLSYHFPRWGGLRVGFSIKAHLTKADLTEFVVGFPFWQGK